MQRGREYQRGDRVVSLRWEAAASQLVAEVRGSAGRRYRQEIEFGRVGRNLVIDGYCSCPMDYNCKHVAAVLLQWLQAAPADGGRSGADGLDAWFQTMRLGGSAGPQDLPSPGNQRQVLLFSLEIQRVTGGSLNLGLEFLQSRILKRGGWGKPQSFDPMRLIDAYYTIPPWVGREDQRIARLAQSDSGYFSRKLTLAGEEGGLALELILDSGRGFLGGPEHGQPLRRGPVRRLTLDWTERDGSWQLEASLEPACKEWQVLPLTPAWYLDPASGECGHLEHPLPGAELERLLRVPPVEPKRLPELGGFLAERYGLGTLPLPGQDELVPLTEPARPLLLLDAVEADGRHVHLARLRAMYGPVRLAPVAVDRRLVVQCAEDGRQYLVERDIPSEESWLDRLAGLGFELAERAGLASSADSLDLLFSGPTLAASAGRWQQFLSRDLPQLEAEGWRIERGEDFRLQFTEVARLDGRLEESADGWFDLALDIEHGGQRIPLLPLVVDWLEREQKGPLLAQAAPGQWLEVRRELVQPILDILVELYDGFRPDPDGGFSLGRQDAARIMDLDERLGQGRIDWRGQAAARVRELGKRLREFRGIEVTEPPAGLQAELRGYQRQGLDWLRFMADYGFGGVLADDMGLGKTLQTLSFLLWEKEQGRLDAPALVVAPTSLLGNWRREAERFAPGLRVQVLHGPDRHPLFADIPEHDLLITSYALIPRDLDAHRAQRYRHLILDEAQQVKNPRSKAAQALRVIPTEHRLCLTGTPMENHLGELWSLFDFLMPGFLGDQNRFARLYRTPVEKHGDGTRQQALARRVAPFLLRRTKDKVAAELPPKSEIPRSLELAPDQRRLYEGIRLAMEERVRKLLQKKGVTRSRIEVLDALLKLRQACCDPRLVKLDSARKAKGSAKLELLREMLPELVEEGRRILLFSSFTSMLALIEQELQKLGIDYTKLTGQTRKREEAVARFQEQGVPVFLISLKAGGVGLNLTAADTVILYDPWWNPAAENQAIDRAHRIGQDKPVLVFRLISEGTVEERVIRLQERKRALADGVYGSDEAKALAELSADDILGLFAD